MGWESSDWIPSKSEALLALGLFFIIGAIVYFF